MDKLSDGLIRSKEHLQMIVADIDDNETPSTSKGPRRFHSVSSKVIPSSDLIASRPNDEIAQNNARGVKRKFDGQHNGTRKVKRQKKFRFMNANKDRGEKRKFSFDHSDQPRKRFKSHSFENKQNDALLIKQNDSEINESRTENSSTKPYSKLSNTKCMIPLENSPKPGTSGNHGCIESHYNDIEEADDDVKCAASCVCNAGHSQMPAPIERRFETPLPMRKCLLMRLSYSRANKRYQCCPGRCVKKLRRATVNRIALQHMTEDYDDQSDLRVHRYSWGEWKE